MMGQKLVVALIYLLLGVSIFQSLPKNEYTIWWYSLTVAVYVFGLILLLWGHYIMPKIIRSWNFCGCKVVREKYIVCRDTMRPGEVRIHALLKVIPTQSVAKMDKEAKDSVLKEFVGILQSSATANTGLCYFSIKSSYNQDIRDRIEAKKRRKSLFARSWSVRKEIEDLDREIDLYNQMPTILSGFYIGIVSMTGSTTASGAPDPDSLKMVDQSVKLFETALSRAGLTAKWITGEELNNIARYIYLGDIHERSYF